jgi:hypothetical protein
LCFCNIVNFVYYLDPIETGSNKMKLYTDESTESSRQMLQDEIETLRTRTQEVTEFCNDLEIQLAELRTESNEILAKTATSSEGREKLLEAKIEDLSDRLRLGMGKLQIAIGETSAVAHAGRGAKNQSVRFIPSSSNLLGCHHVRGFLYFGGGP